MNHNEISDWRNIAHTEYEKRKGIEQRLERTTHALGTLKQTLTTSTNYSTLLEKQLAELESKCSAQEAKLLRSIELLKNAKLLIVRRKSELEALTSQIITLNNANNTLNETIDTLQDENMLLKNELAKQTARLEAEESQHQKTNHKLAQTLSKLAATTAAMLTPNMTSSLPPPARTVTSPDVIYAEAGPQEQVVSAASKKENLLRRLFAAFEAEESTSATEDPDTNFIEQVLYIEKQYK